MRSEALKKAQDKYLAKQPPVVSIRFNWRQWEALQAQPVMKKSQPWSRGWRWRVSGRLAGDCCLLA